MPKTVLLTWCGMGMIVNQSGILAQKIPQKAPTFFQMGLFVSGLSIFPLFYDLIQLKACVMLIVGILLVVFDRRTKHDKNEFLLWFVGGLICGLVIIIASYLVYKLILPAKFGIII
jgi:hypothetical protein